MSELRGAASVQAPYSLSVADIPDHVLDVIVLKVLRSCSDATPLRLTCRRFSSAVLRLATSACLVADQPAPLAQCTALRSLHVAHCSHLPWKLPLSPLSGVAAVPESLARLTTLQVTNCHGQIGASEFGELLQLPALKRVMIGLDTIVDDESIVQLANATSLRQLSLDCCAALTDRAVNMLAHLPALECLTLSHFPKLTDVGLRHLSRLSTLTHLELTHCTAVTCPALASLACLTALQRLNLSGCPNLTRGAAALESFTALKHLTALICNDCAFDNEAFLRLAALTRLSRLEVGNCVHVNESALCHLSRLAALEHLAVTMAPLVADVWDLSTLTKLTHLSLQHCERVSGDVLPALAPAAGREVGRGGAGPPRGLSSIQVLSVHGCRHVSLLGLEFLRSLRTLTSLDASCTLIVDTALAHLMPLTALTALNLSGCPDISDNGISHLFCLPLRELALRGCVLVSDLSMPLLGRLSSLRSLALEGCSVSDHGVAFLTHLTLLTLLDLGSCVLVSGQGIAQLARLTALECLDLQGTRATDDGLAPSVALSRLRSLNLTHTFLTDDALAHLARLSSLESLEISGSFSRAGLGALRQLPRLGRLELHHCVKLSADGFPVGHFDEWEPFPVRPWLEQLASETEI